MTWEEKINKLNADWCKAMNAEYNSTSSLNQYYIMSSSCDFRLIQTGIEEGDIEKVRKGISQAKMMYPFIKETLYLQDKYPGGWTACGHADETSSDHIVIQIHKGKFQSPQLSWFGKTDRASILLELSRLIRDGEKKCLKHPRHQKA